MTGHVPKGETVESAVLKSLAEWSLDLPAVMVEWRRSLPSAVE